MCYPLSFLDGSLDSSYFQASTRPIDQKEWLVAKFEPYKEHHDRKTLGQFFPPLYEEYFSRWPLTPTDERIEAVGGKAAVAEARTVEEHVRDLTLAVNFCSNQ